MNKMTIDTLITYFEDFARLIEQLASDCNQLGNVAKIREALKQIVDITMPCEGVTSTELQVNDIAYDAISAPPRNCDVGTAEEQERRWHANCGIGIPNCKHCNVYEWARKSGLVDDKNMIRFDCRFIWAQMPYEEGGSK